MDSQQIAAVQQYEQAYKAGQKYVRGAIHRGGYPYPPALDNLISESACLQHQELGVLDVPIELITGTKSAGRVATFSGDYMPLLPPDSEFAAKWIRLCSSQMEEGIREPIRCYEYMGRFYVQEGHKRVSVLKSLSSPVVRGAVTRILPAWSEDHDIQVYYEFVNFFRLSRIYGVELRHRNSYASLQALLGFDAEHEWTEEERRSFMSAYSLFRSAYEKLNTENLPLTAGEALLVWLKVFPLSAAKCSQTEMSKSISALWPDLRAHAVRAPIEVSTEPEPAAKSLVSRILSIRKRKTARAAFIYAFTPEESQWTRAHDLGRRELKDEFSDQIETQVYIARQNDFFSMMEQAVADGANVIFATTPSMIDACRRTAALHSEVRILNCSLSQPYTGIRTYYPRTYESKFLTGVIAGAMAGDSPIGYIANYPIIGVTADINAFALGTRLTNPHSQVKLAWSCVPGNAVQQLRSQGVRVISNRDAAAPEHSAFAMEWGTYELMEDGVLHPLALPCWRWGAFYRQILRQIMDDVWIEHSGGKAVNYWWGLQSNVLDIILSDQLPEGIRALTNILRGGIGNGMIDPFSRRIVDQTGLVRSDGAYAFSPEEIINMDWLSEIVEGALPAFDELLPKARELTRMLGICRREIPLQVKGASE